MQYSASQVASMALVWLYFCPKWPQKQSQGIKISWGSMPPDPPSLVCLRKLDIHVTPLLKILATGLDSTQRSKLKVYFFVRVYFIHLSVHLFVLNVTLVLHFGISAATPQPHDREFSKVA